MTKPRQKIGNLLPKKIKSRRPSARKKVYLTAAIGIGAVLLTTGIMAALYWQPMQTAANEATAGKDEFFRAQDELLEQDFSVAQLTLDSAIGHFQAAQGEFNKITWTRWVPWLGTQVTAVDNLMKAGISTGQSIREVAAVGSAIAQPITKNDDISLGALSEEETYQLLENIYNAKPKLEEAKRSIDEAVKHVNQLPEQGLHPRIREMAEPIKEKVPQLQAGLDQAISASQILPAVAGHPEQKTYLFLLQNNTELRPTGGFIGTYGILKVTDGDIKYFETDNAYNLDKPSEEWLSVATPWPLARYNATHEWFLRDSNWSPDFPTTAEKAMWFYEQERGPEKSIDGVIAITPTFIESLLTLTGETTVNGLTFTSENFTETLQYEVEKGFLRQGIEESERKEIIGILSKKILDDILILPKSQWPDLWKVVQQNVDQKQLLVYVKDDYTQNYLIKENWGGQIQPVDHDYLTVIDANLASLKSDPAVKRTIAYELHHDANNLIADLRITYNNEGSITWKTTRYRTYVRTYVPSGTTLLQTEGAMVDCKNDAAGSVETVEELDKTSFGTFVCTEPGETKTLHFKYSLPDRIVDQLKDDTYTLLIQKQPGTAAHELQLNLNFKEQVGALTELADNDFTGTKQIDVTTDLAKDRLVDIVLK